MNILLITLIQLFLLSSSKIQLSLDKPSNIDDLLYSSNATIEDLEYSHFLTNLEAGLPTQLLPLEIKMGSDEILILNNNNERGNSPILSNEVSKTFEKIKDNNINKNPAIDKFTINENTIDLKFKSINEINSENINTKSSGIIGLSLGDIESNKNNNKFIKFHLFKIKILT